MITLCKFEEGSTVQMELCGPSKCKKLTRSNERRSNGPPMLRQFRQSKWTTVQWTAYITSIWIVQMDDGPMEGPCYVNLDRPNGRRSTGPSSIWTVQLTAYITVIWTAQNYGCGPPFLTVKKYDRLSIGPSLIWTVQIDVTWQVSDRIFGPSNWTSPDRPFGLSGNVYLDHPIIRSRVIQMDGPRTCIWMVQIHGVKASIWTAKLQTRYVFVYLDASKSTVQGRPNGCSPNGRFRDIRVDVNPN